ncbi:MAG: hypothetical protein ISS81_04950 [Candidatus Marinimicrobia bacterium]|nr:hypothetical protein [Candidatus Neomarinimicrobiota bacterium]
MDKTNLIAQWAFDTSPILGRFHLWLEDIKIEWIREKTSPHEISSISFVDDRMECLFVTTAAVTALGTRLFGQYGEGKGLDKKGLNNVKKNADAISAYAMSESLWYLSRSLPENHAIMVSLGEGLMPKVGETPEMGSNPLLGFGRIYARPQVAKFLESRVHKLINSDDYKLADFFNEINAAGITIWGTAIDTLENTSRFAKGADTGPMTVLHVFDQPLAISKPYEGYVGNLVLPQEIVEKAAEESLLIDFFTPREKVLNAIKVTYPKIKTENIHVWTLRGKSREHRIGKLWKEWESIGVNIIDEGWILPTGQPAFTDSGTYAPTFTVGTWKDKKDQLHIFIIDGYAASAEAVQAASLYPILDLNVFLTIFSSKFELSYDQEPYIIQLNPEDPDFSKKLSAIFKRDVDDEKIEMYRDNIRQAKSAGIPLNKKAITADDFFPQKQWRVMAISGFMLPDPYTNSKGVEKINNNTYSVTVRLSTRKGDKRIRLTFRLLKTFEESKLVFNPLLNRFMAGEDFRHRPIKISDSGRIRNELQTLCSEALEYFDSYKIRMHFNMIPEDVISKKKQIILRKILEWYKENHPIWFKWLELG